MELRSSAFFSRDWTHTFLFCLQREAAARLRSRNLRRFSSGSSLVVLRRRPPVLGGLGAGATGEAWKITRVNSTFVLKAENWLSQLVQMELHYRLMFVFSGFACREQKLLLESLWWRWLAAGGNGGMAPRLWAGGKREQEWDLQSQPAMGLRWEKLELPCGLQHCSGFHHLHWLPEEEAGLPCLWVSGERIKNKKMVQKRTMIAISPVCSLVKRLNLWEVQQSQERNLNIPFNSSD